MTRMRSPALLKRGIKTGITRSIALWALAAMMLCVPLGVHAEPAPQQTIYWWQDEIRVAAWALSEAQTGRVSQWPKMTLPAGSATLPLPLAAGPIRADGRLDEDAWQHATTLPVGPLFDRWNDGPFMLEITACRDDKNLYLAIQSPRDLTGLGALTPSAELFAVGKRAFHVGPGGNLPEASVRRRASGHVIEIALPLQGDVNLTFPVELVRRAGGELPPEAAHLGLDRFVTPGGGNDFRKPNLWLEPVRVVLLPARAAARLMLKTETPGETFLTSSVEEPEKGPVRSQTTLKPGPAQSVYPYRWECQAEDKTFRAEGFFYREPVAATLAAVGEIAERAAALGSTRLHLAPSSERIAALEAEARRASPLDRKPWRALYCRAREARASIHLAMLDAPLLFVKQHPYFAAHIYDDYYTWHPGGGIYVLSQPQHPGSGVRTIIDPASNETLGHGVYRDPSLSWDATRLVFANRPGPEAVTSIYEIGVDGRGLRRLTSSDKHSDITPAYLPNGRIVFTSTRPRALVPCFNSGVDTLHTIAADGSDLRSISSNNVNEFDPAVLADGRIVYGRWEYVDKTALYMQSLWTMLPDGRMEEALFGNNLAKPTAILDARPVPQSRLVVASLTPHNGQAVGAVGMIDPSRGKNDLDAIFNFTPEYPVEMDQGLRSGPCDPWPLSADDLLVSNNALAAHGVIELVDRFGNRELVHSDPEISCYAPMLLKPRPRPTEVKPHIEPASTGQFLLVDVYRGLGDVPRGSIKRLRIVEETARTSGIPPGGRWWNQAFLVSWQGAYVVKNFLGTVPVHPDGSAFFEVPAGRAVYFELLDEEGREIQRMRTFVQAVPGTTRSCVGCHENKKTTPPGRHLPAAALGPPDKPQPESWGSGYIDYPTMIQPILDEHCVRCHGGPEGINAGLDFSGGWTWAFNISYETLLKHCLTGFLNCHNSSVHTAEILPPRTIGSGAARLAEILIDRHPEVPRRQRDLLLAWMDTNSNYYGTWDYTPHATCDALLATRAPLAAAMKEAGCTDCHQSGHIGNDWVNLQTPEHSRILRAPMAESDDGLGVAMCRKRKARTGYPLIDQSIQPPDFRLATRQPPWDPGGEVYVAIASTGDPHYRAMLDIIRRARADALTTPRVDMPGAEISPGECRLQVAIPVPVSLPDLSARLRPDYALELAWQRTAQTIGLQYELHRATTPEFTPVDATRIGLTTAGRFVDLVPPPGQQHYALVVTSGTERSKPVRTSFDVLDPPPPDAPANLTAEPLPGEITLAWEPPSLAGVEYVLFRAQDGSTEFTRLTPKPLAALGYTDRAVAPGTKYAYAVRSLDRRGRQSGPSSPVEATPLRLITEPVFATDFAAGPQATLHGGGSAAARLQAGAKVVDAALELGATGRATFDHLTQFDLGRAISLECWVRIDTPGQMPVIASAGTYNANGWFLQRYGAGWRWHLAPVSCDGGRPAPGRWTHLVGTFDGRQAALYQDGKLATSVPCAPNRVPWQGPLTLGQYSRPGASYQVQGAITGLKIYHRALHPEEILQSFQTGHHP